MSRKKRRSVAEWQTLVDEQQNSGLSVKAFCREHGLVDKTFYNQRHKLSRRRGSADRTKPGFVQVQPSPSAAIAPSGFLVLQHRHSRLELSAAVSPAWLAELMGALS